MTQLLATILPYLIVGMLALALALFLVALQQLRRGRTGPYWRLRRQAGQRGGQLLLLALALFSVAFALAFFSGLADLALDAVFLRNRGGLQGVIIPSATAISDRTATPTRPVTVDARQLIQATQNALLTLTALPPPTQISTAVPTATLTATTTPTVTDTPTVTATPTATFESVLNLTPMESARQPRPGAMIELVDAAVGAAEDGTPLDPATTFEAGIQRIYLFIRYEEMDNGVSWSRILYREDVPIQGQSYIWSLGEAGSSYFFFGDAGGYPAGSYEVRIYLGTEEISRLDFTIRESS